MAKASKTQRQMAILGFLVIAIGGVAIFAFRRGTSVPAAAPFNAPLIATGFSRAVFDNPEYSHLSTPLNLPIQAGPLGNKNPFTPK